VWFYRKDLIAGAHDFLKSFQPFLKTVLEYAHVFSLTQTLVKITAPGVPDIYQGCELWDTSYVDPDNRRPVDFIKRRKYLQKIRELEAHGITAVYSFIACEREEGLEKLYLTWKALQCRRNRASLFLHGNYIPVYASVDCGIMAYAREYEHQWVVVVAPVSETLLTKKELLADTYLHLPANAPQNWKNEFTGESIIVDNKLPLQAVCSIFPLALLTGTKK
jgi:(1->4)-alpha-D-glucan 1-alpha-D-glucosylmutase